LDQLWIRNEESSSLLYALNEDEYKPSIKYPTSGIKNASSIFEEKYKEHVKNNETLRKIHLQIDSYLYLQEKDEEETQREIFEAGYPYDPPD
jgi:hypothetical protein